VFKLDAQQTTEARFNRGFFNVKRWTADASKTAKGLGQTWNEGLFSPGSGTINSGGIATGLIPRLATLEPTRKGGFTPRRGRQGMQIGLNVFNNGV
jgi:hypothetical protein